MLSILQEIGFAKGDLRNGSPQQLHLIYVTKKSEDISLLNTLSHLLLNQNSEFYHLKLTVYVTQEKKGGSNLRELLSSYSKARTILFDQKNSSYTLGTGNVNLLWMCAITGFSSVIFLISLCFFNQFLFTPKQKSSKPKSPSSLVDFFLFCSFLTAVACSVLVAIALRWRDSRRKREIKSTTWDNGDDIMKLSAIEGATTTSLEEHEIHYGTRPIFKDLLSRMEDELRGSNVGVVVCGPESMKESVASACHQKCCQAIKSDPKQKQAKQQTSFTFHSLNFSL